MTTNSTIAANVATERLGPPSASFPVLPDAATGDGAPSSEKWRPIPGFKAGYEVSSAGRIRSQRGLRKLNPDSSGYAAALLAGADGRRKNCYVHRAVLSAFVRLPRKGEVARHIDGNLANNHLSNLAWGTQALNMSDRARHGNNPVGARNGRAKLNDAAALDIYLRVKLDEESQTKLAGEYGVDPSTVKQIIDGETWRHVTVVADKQWLHPRPSDGHAATRDSLRDTGGAGSTSIGGFDA